MFKRGSKFWYAYAIVCVFLVGKFLHDRKIDEFRNSVKMKAVVTDQIETRGRRRYTTYNYPQYSFCYNDSTYITADRSAHAKGLAIGDSVTILFTKDNPGDAVVYSFFRYWIPLPYLIIGAILSIFFYFAAINIADYIDWKNDPDKKE
jgi:hypothetical protein